jgi:hypothetical protein
VKLRVPGSRGRSKTSCHTKKKATLAKVNDRVAKDQAKVEIDYTDARKKADAEKSKGDRSGRGAGADEVVPEPFLGPALARKAGQDRVESS